MEITRKKKESQRKEKVTSDGAGERERERERKREREREKEREGGREGEGEGGRERETDRQTDRQTKRMVVNYRKDQKDETEGDRRRNSVEDEESETEERNSDT